MLRYRQNYYEDYCYLKRMGDVYKLIKCNYVRIAGMQTVGKYQTLDIVRRNGHKFLHKEEFINYTAVDCSCSPTGREHPEGEKLRNNMCRAKNKILEYVLCNDFDFFVTITLDKEKIDRYELKEWKSKFSTFIRDYNKRHNADIKYVLVPERHKDGAWHFHGFIMGLPLDRLQQFRLDDERKLPLHIVKRIKKGEKLYEFREFTDRFGWNLFDPVKDKKAAALYMTKYITKELADSLLQEANPEPTPGEPIKKGAHLYYCSKGLKKAEIVKKGQFLGAEGFNFDFEHKFGASSMFDSPSDTVLERVKALIGGAPVTLDDYLRGRTIYGYVPGYRKNKDGFYSGFDEETGEIFTNLIDFGYSGYLPDNFGEERFLTPEPKKKEPEAFAPDSSINHAYIQLELGV